MYEILIEKLLNEVNNDSEEPEVGDLVLFKRKDRKLPDIEGWLKNKLTFKGGDVDYDIIDSKSKTIRTLRVSKSSGSIKILKKKATSL